MTKEQLDTYKSWLKDMVKDTRTSFNERVAYKVALDKLNEVLDDTETL